LSLARKQIGDSLERVEKGFQPCSASELEDHMLTFIGEPTYNVRLRITGKAVGDVRWGSIADFGLFSRNEDIIIVVINADQICQTSSMVDLRNSVQVSY
jgi:hypothetical protein